MWDFLRCAFVVAVAMQFAGGKWPRLVIGSAAKQSSVVHSFVAFGSSQ